MSEFTIKYLNQYIGCPALPLLEPLAYQIPIQEMLKAVISVPQMVFLTY